ncbi:HlyD family type I secretion periplasmic adaptor subunit [Rhodospirillum sp. A1_3_36]|uniref:HlyD family type I secretion periplasmic adaptor subunit n=1 Tax=Rhodospirillum sp. A1_3_36 TaxID=3391666 RepID=UPI0039A64FEE
MWLGATLIALLVLVFGGWAALSSLAGAVIAPGQIKVEGNRRTVQHLEGGIVAILAVREGQVVRAGDLLIGLDDTVAASNLAIVSGQLDAALAREARLIAERDGGAAIAFPDALLDHLKDPEVLQAVIGQEDQFRSRTTAREGRISLLRQKEERADEEARGLAAQKRSVEKQLRLITQQLAGLRELLAKGYARKQRVLELEREAESLEGERGGLASDIARTRTNALEARLEIAAVDEDFREEVTAELDDARAKILDLGERKTALDDQSRRTRIVSPIDGKVVGLAVFTRGGVVQPGAPLMDIVPLEERLIIEARVSPTDIDKVVAGQGAVLRLSAFNQRSTPELNGVVDDVSGDALNDPNTGEPYYTVRVRIPEAERTRLPKGLDLKPGMPVEAMLQTGSRSALSYLVKPLNDAIARTFREE